MDPWYRVVATRKEVREGRSFNPDEFAIALEQVVAGTAPEDYRDPASFFARSPRIEKEAIRPELQDVGTFYAFFLEALLGYP